VEAEGAGVVEEPGSRKTEHAESRLAAVSSEIK